MNNLQTYEQDLRTEEDVVNTKVLQQNKEKEEKHTYLYVEKSSKQNYGVKD